MDARIEALETSVAKCLQLQQRTVDLMEKVYTRKKQQAKSYQKRKAKKKKGLRNPECNNVAVRMGVYHRDTRLGPLQEGRWARVAFHFAESARGPYAFLQWLCYEWNCNTYWVKPITRSGGYNHVMIFSGEAPLRQKYSDNELFGCLRRTSFTRIQQEQFSSAIWWWWGSAMLGRVVFSMRDEYEERWAKVDDRFKKPLMLMMGHMGEVEVRNGLHFDQNEKNPDKLGKAYRFARLELDAGWNACKKGLFAKEEPFQSVVSGIT
ncbi:MAG: hypothetical protein CMH98_04545 [Oceanospirillaceae bacterium]|nr:hypothetical protein [Oceanospirillaceae bacterium]